MFRIVEKTTGAMRWKLASSRSNLVPKRNDRTAYARFNLTPSVSHTDHYLDLDTDNNVGKAGSV